MLIRIITDDFTSATDGLPTFSERGWSTSVCLNVQSVVQTQVANVDTDSRKHIARDLQAHGISVLREVQAGIPLCLLHTPSRDVPLITKAGGFGEDEVFADCLKAIRREIIESEFT